MVFALSEIHAAGVSPRSASPQGQVGWAILLILVNCRWLLRFVEVRAVTVAGARCRLSGWGARVLPRRRVCAGRLVTVVLVVMESDARRGAFGWRARALLIKIARLTA